MKCKKERTISQVDLLHCVMGESLYAMTHMSGDIQDILCKFILDKGIIKTSSHSIFLYSVSLLN